MMQKARESRVRSAKRGFTIIELLVALALLGLLATFLSGGVVFGRRAWEQGERQDRVMARDTAIQVIVEQLERAIPLRQPGNSQTIMFRGASDAISFIAIGDASVETGGLRQISVGKTATRSGRFELTIAPVPGRIEGARGTTGRTASVVEIDTLSFRYIGRLEPGGNAVWSDTWKDRLTMPDAVELSLGVKASEWKLKRVIVIKG
jgi:general secretion pathway protein J